MPRRQRHRIRSRVIRQSMLNIKFSVDTADKRYRLVSGAKGPLAGCTGETGCQRMFTSKGKRTGVTGFGLFGILLRMTFPAACGTGVLAGRCLEQQPGQHETTTCHYELPDESSTELNLTSEYTRPLRRYLTERRGGDAQIRIGAGKPIRQIVRLTAKFKFQPLHNLELFSKRRVDVEIP